MRKLLFLILIASPSAYSYTDYQCVSQCTSRGLLYNSCVEKCSDTPNDQGLKNSQDTRERQQNDFDRTMRQREQNERSGGRSAFEMINGK